MESKMLLFWSRATASSSSTDENLHISENCVPSVITADNNATAANIVENMASSVSSNDQNTPSAAECNTTITQTPQQDKLQSEIARAASYIGTRPPCRIDNRRTCNIQRIWRKS